MSRYTEDQLVALNALKGAVQYLNHTGLKISSWMAQGFGIVSVVPVEDDDWDSELSPDIIDKIIRKYDGEGVL